MDVVHVTGGDLTELAEALQAACRDARPAAVRVDAAALVGGTDEAGVVASLRRSLTRAAAPSVLAVTGPVDGAGLAALLAFDVVVCHPDCRFTPGEAAALLACGTATALVRRTGAARARAFVLAGRPWDAATAAAAGLVDVVDPDPAAVAGALCRDWTAGPAAGLVRRAFLAAERLSADEATEFGQELARLLA